MTYKIREADFIIKRDFNDIVEENTDFVAAIVKKFVRDPETVKDLTQEIFLRVYTNYERYTEEGKIRAWLAIIANNMLKNHYKAEQYQNSHFIFSPIEYISDELVPFKSMPEDIVIQQDFLAQITKIINTLPEKQRNAIIYSYFYDYSEKEIAAIQDMTLSAVKSAKYFGLEKVRKLIGSDYDGGENKKYKLNKFGRYKMVKCYKYDSSIFTEHTDLQKDSLIELISPTKKYISDVAKFLEHDKSVNKRLFSGEDTIKALVNGDFNKIDYPATRVNDSLNVAFLEVEYILVSHEEKTDKNKDTLKHLSKIGTLLNVPGYINLDYADVHKMIKGAKALYTGAGAGKGENKRNSVETALSSPLLANNIDKSSEIIVNVTASPDIHVDDIDAVASKIHKNANKANIIFGVNFDNEMIDEMNVTIIASDK